MSLQPPCPICDKPRSDKYRPFCSPRCADVDLQRWLAGTYVLPDENSTCGGDGGDEEPDEIAGQGRSADL